MEILHVLISKEPKSVIVKNSSTLTGLFMRAFDLRRIQFSPRTEQSYDDDEVEEVEAAVRDVAIEMIYKMNDATFRPLFTNLLEWASGALPKSDKKGRTLRLITLFAFLARFFDTLKVRRSRQRPLCLGMLIWVIVDCHGICQLCH